MKGDSPGLIATRTRPFQPNEPAFNVGLPSNSDWLLLRNLLSFLFNSSGRGSGPHNHDPSGAASYCYRESGRACRIGKRGFSFVLASAAAGSVLEISVDVHRMGRLCFSLLGCFCFCLFFCQAAIRSLTVVSALVPMAQMKPSSSRATAVVIFLLSLPAAASLM
jgi:hypothetical protein